MRHFLAQFGPALEWPWTKLTDVPELTDELVEQARGPVGRAGGTGSRCASSSGCATTTSSRSSRRCARSGTPRGAVLHEHEARLVRRRRGRRRPDPTAAAAPPRGGRRPVLGRLQRPHDRGALPARVRRGDRRALRHVGLDADYLAGGTARTRSRRTSATSARSPALEPLAVETQVLGADEKRLHLFHTMRTAPSGETLATGEHMLLHVDTDGRADDARGASRVASRLAAAAAGARGAPLPGRRGTGDRDARQSLERRAGTTPATTTTTAPGDPGRADALVQERHGERRRDDDARLAHRGDRTPRARGRARRARGCRRRRSRARRSDRREPDRLRAPPRDRDARASNARNASVAGIIESSWYTTGDACSMPRLSTSVYAAMQAAIASARTRSTRACLRPRIAAHEQHAGGHEQHAADLRRRRRARRARARRRAARAPAPIRARSGRRTTARRGRTQRSSSTK